MIVMGLDIATVTGWAVYDLDRPPSAIISGSIRLEGDTAFDKVQDLRGRLPRIIKEHRPGFAAIEAPMEFAPAFKKVRKTLMGEEEVGSTINSKTIALLNRLAGAAEMAVLGQNVPCVSVRPQTWQSAVIPKAIVGPSKLRAKLCCDLFKIVAANADARDAALIAIWCAGHSQELKMLRRDAA